VFCIGYGTPFVALPVLLPLANLLKSTKDFVS